jgi:hypothetical protein
MGRSKGHAYQVKNTFVECTVPSEDADYSRSGRTMSANDMDNQHVGAHLSQDDNFMAKTPSPFLHPAHAPSEALLQMPPLQGYDLPSNGMIAFGDIPADFSLSGFEEEHQTNNYSQAMMYDPASGMYMAYDWQAAYNQGCFPMMAEMQNGMGEEFQLNGNFPMQQNSTETLLAALGEKLGKGPEDNSGMYAGGGYCDSNLVAEAYDPASEIFNPALDMPSASSIGAGAPHDHSQQMGERGGRKNRNRDRGDRGDRGDRNDRMDRMEGGDRHDADGQENQAPHLQGPVNFTTVMFRNIPNKYTREMLVKQLEQDLKGHFDFVYLPIDFKNKCNVGYAFINFRSIEACETFLNNFNGVEVRKCLPGLNSRKVTEVTPARVQGFEENVQRLRNSPVMRELAHHAEWMPLIFDGNGEQVQFPAPERPLEPIKPRRRGREDPSRNE